MIRKINRVPDKWIGGMMDGWNSFYPLIQLSNIPELPFVSNTDSFVLRNMVNYYFDR